MTDRVPGETSPSLDDRKLLAPIVAMSLPCWRRCIAACCGLAILDVRFDG